MPIRRATKTLMKWYIGRIGIPLILAPAQFDAPVGTSKYRVTKNESGPRLKYSKMPQNRKKNFVYFSIW